MLLLYFIYGAAECGLDILYELRFADWLDSVPEDYLATEADCSLSKDDAKNIIQTLSLHYS